jgi:ribonucleoside-diphosphate reductase alpha chain
MTYTQQQVLDATRAYAHDTYAHDNDLIADVFATKYALSDGTKYFELTPDDMHKRLAREFARIEAKYINPVSEETIYQLLQKFSKVIPQGSPQSGIGNPFQIQSLSNCFVIDSPEDSYGGIFRADEEIAQIMKRRGGVGLDMSPIRPKGFPTKNAAKTTDGIAVFMERFSNTCREVAQGGRRGALMLTLSVHHPEIITFIKAKLDLKKVTGANISIRISDEFMRAVETDQDYEQRWPVDATHPSISLKVKAKDVWNEIVSAAHKCAEPGVLFWDTVNKMTPADAYAEFRSISTNPCSELPLPAYDSCRLILMNWLGYVLNPFTQDARLDKVALHNDVIIAQRLMDDLIDLEIESVENIINKIDSDKEPESIKAREKQLWLKIKKKAEDGRRTGLGATGLGDALAMLNTRYGSDESLALTDEMYKIMCTAAWESSIILAQERGAFPVWNKELEKDHPFINMMLDACGPHIKALHEKYGRRNIALTMSSPAGSISIEADCTNAIEPMYVSKMIRRRKLTAADGDTKPDFVDAMGDRWKEYTIEHAGLQHWKRVTNKTDIKESPYYRASAAEIDYIDSVKMQATVQKWICHGISKTVNMPASATLDDVATVYFTAWRTGCKGVTVYRDKCRSGVLLNAESVKNYSRPKSLICDIHRVNVKGEPYVVIIGKHNNELYEVFAGALNKIDIPKSAKHGTLIKHKKAKNRATYDLEIQLKDNDHILFTDIIALFENPTYGAMTRLISMLMRNNVATTDIIEQLKKDKHSDISSFASCIARVLKTYVPDGTTLSDLCEHCDQPTLQYQSGCVICASCGSSKCN